jgi:hypothetical protein
MTLKAAITADIVNSTKLPSPAEKKLKTALSAILESHKYEFYRGDSFQVFLKSPEDALLIALLIRSAAMKIPPEISNSSIDVRVSIGIGQVNLPIKTLMTATGEAFVLSGRAFDQMKNGERLVITCNEKNQLVNLSFKLASRFIDYLFQHMTYKQAAVVHELLQNRTQVEAAKKLKKSQATIHKHTQSAGWPELEKLLVEYKQILNSIQQ